MLKISIITPVFNRIHYLESTIKSVLSQGYPNLEYIIIDGGSTDGTLEIIRKYESQLKYWISEPDKGMYEAIQKGFDKATGDVLAWLNSDDLYQPNSLFIVADIFSDLENIDWITGTPSLFNKNGQCVKIGSDFSWSKKRFSVGDFRWIQQESTFWRKSLWYKAGGYVDLNFKLASDFELWCRFFDFSTLYSVNTLLAGFRLHGDQISLSKTIDYEKEVNIIFKQYYRSKRMDLNRLYSFIFTLHQCSTSSKFIQRILRKITSYILKHIYRLPKLIYYDFNLKRWII